MIQSSNNDNLIPESWRLPVSILSIATAVTLFTLYFMGLKPFYQELVRLCMTPSYKILEFSIIEVGLIEQYGWDQYTLTTYYFTLETILILLFSVLAVLVFLRRSDTWVGIVVSIAFLFIGLIFFAEENRALARVIPELQLFTDFLTSIAVTLMLMLFYLFPDGRFTPRWMRWFTAALFAVVFIEPFLHPDGAQMASASAIVIVTFAIGVPMGLISQIYRFRWVSNSTERQQTKWILLGFIAMFAGMLPWLVFAEINPLPPGANRLLFYLSMSVQYTLICSFPIAVVIAIMRYRLWDIDLVVRRTLQYALVTSILALTYLCGIVILQGIVGPLTASENSPVVTVVTTLGIAALFTPLRSRVKDFIDQRFYRKKYDAEQTLAEFATTARDEVDMEIFSTALLGVVDDTMQPEQVSLWLKR